MIYLNRSQCMLSNIQKAYGCSQSYSMLYQSYYHFINAGPRDYHHDYHSYYYHSEH
ncbi:unnamed protein product [Amoebophrya sp. A25]|nr:unnamed protein product [Amoebophrya sp. A25]|eukprot:GSA25T00021700001.1